MCRRILITDELVARAMEEWSKYRMREGVFGCFEVQVQASRMAAWRFWSLNGYEKPDLKRVAIRVLAQVASSCSCERLNNEADHIKPLKANRYNQANFERHIHVHHNLHVLDNITALDYEEVAIFVR